MNINTFANTIKDTSRSIYIQLVAGQTCTHENLLKDIRDLENALVGVKACIALEKSGYCLHESDLKGLAAREAQ